MSKIVNSLAAAAVVLGLSVGAANAAVAPKSAPEKPAATATHKAEKHKTHASKVESATKTPAH